MTLLDDFRAQNTAYKDVPDDKLSEVIYNKFYAQKMSRDDFNSKLGAPKPMQPPTAAPTQPMAAPPTAKPVEQPPTGMDTAKQYAGAVGRGVAGAAAGAGELAVRAPYNATQYLLSKAFPDKQPRYMPSLTEATEKGLTAAGVPEPKTFGQKAAQYGTEVLVGGGAAAIKDIAKGVLAPSTAKLQAITDIMHRKATATIEAAKNSGIKFSPDVSTELTAGFDGIKDLSTAGEAANRPLTAKAISDMKKSLDSGDTSLRNILGFRDKMTDIVRSGGQEGSAALKAKKVIDAVINKAKDKVVAGDPKSLGLVDKFRNEWGQFKNHDDFTDLLVKHGDSPAKIKSELRKIVDDPEKIKTYSTEVQNLIRTGAKGKTSGNIMQAVGSIKRLFGVGVGAGALGEGAAVMLGHSEAGVAPLAAAGAAYLGSSLAKAGAKQVAQGTVQDILRAIQAGK